MTFQERLAEVAAQVREGRNPTATVRELLDWHDAYRRGYWIVQSIRRALEQTGLRTEPDFESAYIDASITFVPAGAAPDVPPPDPAGTTEPPPPAPVQEPIAGAATVSWADPTYRISKLASANRQPVSVTPDAPVTQAATLMLSNDFSQLPVMSGEREVKGVISWSSIGRRLAFGRIGATAQDLMDQHQEIRADASIFSAIPILAEHGYVLVRGSDNRIIGIVTASDLNYQFRQLAEPFLLLGEIENHIRRTIDDRFSQMDLAATRDPSDAGREVRSVADLSFGEYVRLVENPERWTQLGLPVHRGTFVERLDRVREIRNDVMHFDPDGIPDTDLEALRDFTSFLRRLREMGVP